MTRQVEQAILLGPRSALVGVPTRAADVTLGHRVAVILNAGIIHRVGPNRLGVQMARAIAADGLDVLRFDLSGIGDSAPRSDELLPLDAAMADIREALDSLEKNWNKREVILIGLCSGADHAVCYAGNDDRVIGAVLMDPTLPHTVEYYLRFYFWKLKGLFSLVRLKRFVSGVSAWASETARSRRAVSRERLRAPPGPDIDSPEARKSIERAYVAALAGGRHMLAVFTDGLPSQHIYERQIIDALPGVNFGAQFRSAYIHGADHTFTNEAHRDQAQSIVRRWVKALPRPPAQ